MDEYLIIAYLKGKTTPEQEKEILKHITTSEEERKHLAEMKALHHWLRKGNPLLGEISFNAESRERKRKRWKTAWIVSVAASLLIFVIAFTIGRDLILERTVTSFHNPDSVASRITLPDGSAVYMREGASLSYNRKKHSHKREVHLEGEAFFEVSKANGKPFYVKTKKGEIVVHGTTFNVKALNNEKEMEAILASGSISLHDKRGKLIANLQRGQQAIFNPSDGSIKINHVQTWNILLARYHFVMLSEVPVNEVVDIIQKTYHIRLTTNDKVPKNQLITFKFQKSTALEDVIEMLELVSGHDYSIVSDNI